MRVVNSMAELIGNTPLVKLKNVVEKQWADIYVKLEYYNPSGSLKDRAAYYMIERAEESGLLRPGATVIEPTSGNTGIGLAMITAAKGYKVIIVMPDSSTAERVNILKAYGAEVVFTPSAGKMPAAIKKAQEIASRTTNSFIPMQFENEANPDIHRLTTAKEIIRSMEAEQKQLDAFVCTAGTGGTITGTGETLKQYNSNLKNYVVEPSGSPVLSGGKPGKHKLVGTSPGFIPKILNTNIYDEIIQIEDQDAYDMVHKLASNEGILLGPSGGASVYAATVIASRLQEHQTVVCVAPDSGERYLTSDLFAT